MVVQEVARKFGGILNRGDNRNYFLFAGSEEDLRSEYRIVEDGDFIKLTKGSNNILQGKIVFQKADHYLRY
ncbi:hypothetical protein K9L16_00205 [Candidatus Pacearchaeota archaeon]|nr:hypothetical protein [Candidatus Pacearchaeota archaeon]